MFFDEMATDDLECKALSFKRDYVDIYCNSWGPDDRGFEVVGPGPLAQRALQRGAEEVTKCSPVKKNGEIIVNCKDYIVSAQYSVLNSHAARYFVINFDFVVFVVLFFAHFDWLP